MTSFGKSALLLALLLGTFGTPAAASPVDAGLERRVAERIAQQWRVAPERVRLTWGYVPAFLRGSGGKTAHLAGAGTDGWLAVVIRTASGRSAAVRVRAGVLDSVWVAARPLAAGAKLQPEDMRRESRLVWGRPRAKDVEPAPGWKVRRSLSPGAVLAPPAVEAPPLVEAGRDVELRWVHGDVSVTLTGVAVNSAREGDKVRVRVPGRRRPLTGTATGPGIVELQTGGRR